MEDSTKSHQTARCTVLGVANDHGASLGPGARPSIPVPVRPSSKQVRVQHKMHTCYPQDTPSRNVLDTNHDREGGVGVYSTHVQENASVFALDASFSAATMGCAASDTWMLVPLVSTTCPHTYPPALS